MSAFDKLQQRISKSNSLLCVGLDPSPDNALYTNALILEATYDYAACYKLNLAFYLTYPEGMTTLADTLKMIPKDTPVILDAKFGDIENTASRYAKFTFETLGVDGVTVNPYMGEDAIKPFSKYSNKMVFSLAATSNPSSKDIQSINPHGFPYSTVAIRAAGVAISATESNNVGLVVGDSSKVGTMRHYFRYAWFLCPGVGAQGGNLKEFVTEGKNEDGTGLLINVGRGISSAGNGEVGYTSKIRSIRDKSKEYVDKINEYR